MGVQLPMLLSPGMQLPGQAVQLPKWPCPATQLPNPAMQLPGLPHQAAQLPAPAMRLPGLPAQGGGAGHTDGAAAGVAPSGGAAAQSGGAAALSGDAVAGLCHPATQLPNPAMQLPVLLNPGTQPPGQALQLPEWPYPAGPASLPRQAVVKATLANMECDLAIGGVVWERRHAADGIFLLQRCRSGWILAAALSSTRVLGELLQGFAPRRRPLGGGSQMYANGQLLPLSFPEETPEEHY